MKSLLLLDADVAIHFHELSYWEAILKQYTVYLTPTVFDEIKRFDDESGKTVFIDLQPYITNGQIIEVSPDIKTHLKIIELLKIAELDNVIHDGELDCICVLYENIIPDLHLGIKDGVAIQSIAYLDLEDRSLCIEDILKGVGILRANVKVPKEYSIQRYKDLVCKGKFLQLEKPLKKIKN